MARYIDKDKVIEEISRLANRSMVGEIDEPYLDWKTVASVIFNAPTADVVEIVRCKDCKHATFYSCKNDACSKGIFCDFIITTGDENFYCACGERRKEDAGI